MILKAGEFQFDGTSAELTAVMKHTQTLVQLIIASNGNGPTGAESSTELSGQDGWVQDATPPVLRVGFTMKEEV